MVISSRLSYDPICPLDVKTKPIIFNLSKDARCGFSKVQAYGEDAIEMICCSPDDAQLTIVSRNPKTLKNDLQLLTWNPPKSPFPLNEETAAQIAEIIENDLPFPESISEYAGGE